MKVLFTPDVVYNLIERAISQYEVMGLTAAPTGDNPHPLLAEPLISAD